MRNRKKRGGESGFTFIEMSILIILAGLLIAAVLPLYTNYTDNKNYRVTLENMRMAQEALREFYSLYGRYPCPARPDAAPGDTDYGTEIACRAAVTDPCPAGLVCTDVGTRDADNDGNADFVLVGTLPFTLLANTYIILFSRFKSMNGFDGFGRKITYAVTEEMTRTSYNIINPANPQLGAISIRDENNRDVVQPSDSAHYIILSHGDNGRGGFSGSGTALGDCTLIDILGIPAPPGNNIGGSGIRVELENCDGNDGVYVNSLRSLADNDSYFDDVLFFNANAMNQLWAKANSPPTQTYLYNTNFGNVGVGKIDPLVKLDISGDIRAETEIQAENGYCKQDGSDCLLAERIGGAAGMTPCPPGWAAIGIQNNDLECAPLFPGGAVSFSCPAGPPQQYVTGFSNLGNPLCSP